QPAIAGAGGLDALAGTVLRRGLADPPRVTALQAALIGAGMLEGTPDGDFGPGTERGLRRFQWYLGRKRPCLRVPKGLAPSGGTLDSAPADPAVAVNGTCDAPTLAALRRWATEGLRATMPLLRVKTARFRHIARAAGFKTLDYPGAADDEVLVNAAFLPGLDALDAAAEATGVRLLLNQAFRLEGAAVAGAVVPPATRSQHLIGHAVDLNILAGGVTITSGMMAAGSIPQPARDFIAAAKRAGLRWGGDFGRPDPVHFDLRVPDDSPDYDLAYFFCQHLFPDRQPIALA
ncbi:M15 family metallopeptidase, partial [Paracraurococcus ruber]